MSEQDPFLFHTTPQVSGPEDRAREAVKSADHVINPLVRPDADIHVPPSSVAESHIVGDENEFDLGDPHHRVELFLTAYAHHAAGNKTFWRQAAVLQKHLKAVPVTTIDQDATLYGRRDRRNHKNMRRLQREGPCAAINVTTNFSLKAAHQYYDAEIRNNPEAPEKLQTVDPDIVGQTFIERLGIHEGEDNAASVTLARTYSGRVFMAGLTDQRCLELLSNTMAEPALVRPFFERLKELASAPDQREFPGLLELLAVHSEQSPIDDGKNILYNALVEATPDGALLPDFLRSQAFEGDPTDSELSSQMRAAAAIVGLIFKVDHPELNPAVALTQLIEQRDEWQPWLNAQFRKYKTDSIQREWNELEAALRPYIHRGRFNKLELPAERVKGFKGGAAELDARIADQISQTDRIIQDAINEAVKPEKEPDPITQFVFLKSAGTGSDRVLTYGEVLESLDDVMSQKPFQSYITMHRHDDTIEPQLREAIKRLIKDPYCHEYARKYMTGSFNLQGQSGNQSTRRFSFQRFPGSGKVTRQSRLYYALLSIDGKDTLAFMDIKNKNEVGTGLPL